MPDVTVAAGQAVRIMTGAPVPDGADTVVRFEDTFLDGDTVEILSGPGAGVVSTRPFASLAGAHSGPFASRNRR